MSSHLQKISILPKHLLSSICLFLMQHFSGSSSNCQKQYMLPKIVNHCFTSAANFPETGPSLQSPFFPKILSGY